jgi:hypothetical protein
MEDLVSFKSRERKRAINAARRVNGDVMRERWYLTIVKRKTSCVRCAGVLNRGKEMVYRHTPRTALCKLCAESDQAIEVRPSTSWEKRRRRSRKRS